MDIDKVQQDLRRRFSQPLPEFYSRRIIFWYDEDQEFADQLDGLELPDVELFILNGHNSFVARKTMTRDKRTSNFLVYCPLSFSSPDDDWLLDMKIYGEEFRADRISIWMDEMGIPSSANMRDQVKRYRKFFNAKERRDKFMKFRTPGSPKELHLNVMATITGTESAQPASIIRTVLMGGLNKDANAVYQDLVTYGADKTFMALVRQGTGYAENNFSLERLLAQILLTAASRTLPAEYLAGLEKMTSAPHAALCYDFVTDWFHKDPEGIYDMAGYVEDAYRLRDRFQKIPVDDLVDTEVFPCIHEVILSKLMADINVDLVDSDHIDAIVEKRRTDAWYDKVAVYYDGISEVANLFRFYKTHGTGFHTVEPKRIWKDYTEEYYKMDTYYRYFHMSFQKSLRDSNAFLDDAFKKVAEKVEGIYSNWFLGQLGSNWTKMCQDALAEYGQIPEIPQQSDFYRDHVKNVGGRIFVIISDAMRYEVAVDLCKQLQQGSHSQVKITNMEGIFPTITKCGMAALLPHKELNMVEKDGHISMLADGAPTDAGYRDGILKKTNPKSVALKYKEIIKMTRADRTALVRGMEVVYIYHDTIDEAGHSNDANIFQACRDTIDELKNMVKIIVNEFSGANIFITADHGFLYTYSPLKEDSKVGNVLSDRVCEYGRRFAITRDGYKSDYLMPIMLREGGGSYHGYAPRENVRIKMNGGGMNFVHGGSSLQEMVVPIVEYHHLRNTSKEYLRNKDKYDTKPVEVAILSSSRKVSNLIFNVDFYQKQSVGPNREAATYNLYFVDREGNKISDVQRIIADKINENIKERSFRCTFSLKPREYRSTELYYLVIADESGLTMPVKEEYQIDIAFATDDFDFFS